MNLRPITSVVASLSLITILQTAVVANAQTSTSASTVTPSTATSASDTAVKKKSKLRKAKGNDFAGDRDCNMFQVEPSIINERYYTSGAAEHHQKTSPTLPPGAPIPDNEGPYQPEKPQVKSSNDFSDKLDSGVKANLIALKEIKNDSPTLKLKLRVSTIDDALISSLKDMKVDVISESKASGDMVVYAPAIKVNEIGSLKQVLSVLLAQ